ncbi:hypothetical protein FG384_12520 [Psychrobacillus vulpis]|uniref:Uncharacterized protein n=1 Tax=Psychrobacillus vulpis TaxID=2325572 RepID=A0A544TPT3_9BACI|nr:hypothetical protein FG384_12520 [Psychrobacillus vulpis]
MKKIGLSILFICIYCFPFVYFSMYQDFISGSMMGYIMMVIITSLVAFFSRFSNNISAIIIGNIVSTIISYYCMRNMIDNERWGGYFKPLTPTHLLYLISLLNLIPQFMAMKLASKYKIRKTPKSKNV